MNAQILLSGYDKTTQELQFRVYASEIPETDRRQSHRAGHFTAAALLGEALHRDFGLPHVRIARSGLEKPVLLHSGLHMNLSHCKGLAVCAVGRLPLGTDCESPRTVRESLLPRICSASETAEILASEHREFAFSRLWTLKEAFAKYTGAGIRTPFDRLPFSAGDTVRFCHPDAGRVSFFQLLHHFSYTVSLCVPHGNYAVSADAHGWILIPEQEGAYADD